MMSLLIVMITELMITTIITIRVTPPLLHIVLCSFFFLISTIIVISFPPIYIVKCVHINTGGTETAAARLCKELLSFCLTPVCFSLWIFLTLKKYYDRKIPRRVTFRVNGLHAVLIVSIHPQTSRLAHTLIHVAPCSSRNTYSKNSLHRKARVWGLNDKHRVVVGNLWFLYGLSRMLECQLFWFVYTFVYFLSLFM